MRRFVLALVVVCAAFAPAAGASADFSFQTTTLEPPAVGDRVESVAVGDVDGRNGPDLVTAYGSASGAGIAVQLNDGHGNFGAPQLFSAAGANCQEVSQVELADVGGPPESIHPDSHLDAVIACVVAGGDAIYLGRMFGDGNGGFSEPHLFGESDYGFANDLSLSHQSFALVEYAGRPNGPPVPVWSRTENVGSYTKVFCLSYDWQSALCTNPGEDPEPYVPFLPARVADAEVFTTGGTEGLVAWGPEPPPWHGAPHAFGPEPPSSDPASAIWRGIAVGDLESDGPDVLTSAGDGGAVPGDSPSGRVSVLYGNSTVGVPAQAPTTFPSALGVENISTGDFDLDGHTDVVGENWHYSAAAGGVGGIFFQAGDGAGHLGSPQETTLYNGETWGTAPLRVADLDGNGAPDVVAVVGGKVRVLLNQKSPVQILTPGNPLSGVKIGKKARASANGLLILGTATNPPTASVGLTLTMPLGGTSKGSPRIAARPKKKVKKKKETVIGKAKIAVPAGKTVKLKLKLSGKARGLLKRGPLHAKLTIKATSTSGVVKTKKQPLTVEPPKAKKKKKKH